MELIRISECKMKIMLSPSDMKKYELAEDLLSFDSLHHGRPFRNLLEQVRKETGFCTDMGTLTVEYYPSVEGGGEMFLSKSQEPGLPVPINTPLPSKAKNKSGFRKECAYRFADLQTVLQVCNRLDKMNFSGSSALYCDSRNCYHLILSVLSESPIHLPKELDFLTEYAKNESVNVLRLYLCEHGTVICAECAVEILSKLV